MLNLDKSNFEVVEYINSRGESIVIDKEFSNDMDNFIKKQKDIEQYKAKFEEGEELPF